MHRRQRSHWLLKDDRDPAAAYRPHLSAVAGQFRNIDDIAVGPRVGEQDFAAGDDTAAREDAEDSLADNPLSRPRLADERDDRSRANPKRNSSDRSNETTGRSQ